MRYVILVSVLHAALAHADHYRRQQTFHIDGKPTERAHPVKPAPPRATPSVSGETMMAIALAQEPIKREQEALLIKLVIETPDSDPDKPDYLFRLAEQYASELRLWRIQSAELRIAADAL